MTTEDLRVELSLLCLGWPCFRFRGFEKSWLGRGMGGEPGPGILGAGQLGRTPDQVHSVCLPRGEPGAPGFSHSAGDI